MRNVSNILKMIRQHCGAVNFTTNSSGSATQGMTTELLLEYVNDGLSLLQSKIVEAYNDEFLDTEEISITGAEAYSITDHVLHGSKILQVEYSNTGIDEDYVVIDKISLRDRDVFEGGEITSYALRANQILPSPIGNNTSAKLRVTFVRALDKLDIRRGKIASKTSTTITLTADADLDATGIFSREDYICVVDALGVVKDYGIRCSSFSTPVITIPSQTIVGVANDYVVVGKYATTHCPLKGELCEAFVKQYAQMRVFQAASSKKALDEEKTLDETLKQIMINYKDADHDMQHIPIVDPYLFD